MLYLHHSNSLHNLADILQQRIGANSADVLEAEQVLVQNPGMKRWLQQYTGKKNGIAANIEFPLPSRFIWDVFLRQFDDVEQLSSYDAEVLRWRLMALLLEADDDDQQLRPLQSYLKQDERGVARWQLAEKLASLFDQYLVYRPQMIGRWEKRTDGLSGVEKWQAHLWRQLRQQNAQPHRAQLINRLIQRVNRDQLDIEQLPRQLFVFAISAMSPLYMNVLNALSRHIDIHFFILNPCKHYWGDIQSRKESLRQSAASFSDYQDLSSHNELLASMGKQGRDYIDQFYDQMEPAQDNHQFVDINPQTLLKRIQFDILNLGQEAVEIDYTADQSIQVVSCYSELRELQVLHDRLLEMLAEDDSLAPHDIVIMCPNVDTLAPYVEAVFGMQPEHKKIPYSISDTSELASTPLIQAIIDWLNLPSSRFSASEVMGWLELPAVRRAYKLEPQHTEIIRHLLTSGHIHWGLDHAHKQQLGLGGDNLNTWAHGIRQLLTAYMMNPDVELFAGQLAAQTVLSSTDVFVLGQLQKFLDDLSDWAGRFKSPQTVQQWQININALIDNSLLLDEDEEWLVKPVREQLAGWQLQVEHAQFTEKLDAVLVAQLLNNSLQQGFAHHQYLSGAVNFCNLIPMRTLPFRVVCLIGMGDDRFPRTETPAYLDLIARQPKKGDRSRREDDRYMFLQSLLSAQEFFYISYVGRSRKDDSVIEPSVVITELIDQVRQSTAVELGIEQTTLQPFSASNFQRGSYAELWQNEHYVEAEPFDQSITAIEMKQQLSLDELVRFFSNPARYFMQQRLNLSLTEYHDMSDDEEIFTLDPLTRYGLNKKLLSELLKKGSVNAECYLRSGELAQQNVGVLQFNQQRELAEQVYRRLGEHEKFDGLTTHELLVQIDRRQLGGHIESFSKTGLLQISLSSIKGKSLFPFWLQHCVLSSAQQAEYSEIFFRDKRARFHSLSCERANSYLQRMLDLFDLGNSEIIPFYVDSAFEYQQARQTKDEHSARQKVQALWSGDNFSPFYESEDAYILTSLKNADTWPEQFFQLAEDIMQPLFDCMEQIE